VASFEDYLMPKDYDMRVCINYHPEGYTTEAPRLMGRNVAGQSFLRGFASYSRAKDFWVSVQNPEHAQMFTATVRGLGRSEDINVINSDTTKKLCEAGILYHSGPDISKHAWRRSIFGDSGWSLCGITHTTANSYAMDSLTHLITAPLQPWDALICTSNAVKDNVNKVIQSQVEYLKSRFNSNNFIFPELPVIPLGIHTDDFVYSEKERQAARVSLEVEDNVLIVLFVGRLSFHAKAHPLAMYQALEKASTISGKEVLLIECGWHANEPIANAYKDAAKLACPSIKVMNMDGRIAANRQVAWAGADIFCSLSDNIQETFGISPLEAMAAGIPIVVSDWDGYRDTVRDGVDGYLIPTSMPEEGLGAELAERYALEVDTYDMYCGHTSSLIAVDVDFAVKSFVKLFNSLELRKEMGAKGRQRARNEYDWKVIIPRYESLWASLDELRRSQSSITKRVPHPWPARMDPFHAFDNYPTSFLTQQSILVLVDEDSQKAIARLTKYLNLAMINYAKAVLPSISEVTEILNKLESGPLPAGELVKHISDSRQMFVFRSLSWLLKMNILKVYK
jgi:glycosyltransferase involved in cell wall biosynthesis